MKKNCFDNQFEIYLFLDSQIQEAPSSLNEFISFLKFNKASIPYKFTFVEQAPILMSDLSINQNILIDFNADSLTNSRDGQFSEFLQLIDNYYIKQLYNKINIPGELPAMANNQIKKLTGLIKSLVKETDFIFLDSPEDYLDSESLELFITALKNQIKIKKQNVFIFSKEVEFWRAHADQVVCRTKDYSFQTEVLIKSATDPFNHEEFYKKNEVDSDILNFRIPEKAQGPVILDLVKVTKIKTA